MCVLRRIKGWVQRIWTCNSGCWNERVRSPGPGRCSPILNKDTSTIFFFFNFLFEWNSQGLPSAWLLAPLCPPLCGRCPLVSLSGDRRGLSASLGSSPRLQEGTGNGECSGSILVNSLHGRVQGDLAMPSGPGHPRLPLFLHAESAQKVCLSCSDLPEPGRSRFAHCPPHTVFTPVPALRSAVPKLPQSSSCQT